MPAESEFQKELENLINRHSRENGSDTPDFILASYLSDCLEAWNKATKAREKWYGRGESMSHLFNTLEMPKHPWEEKPEDWCFHQAPNKPPGVVGFIHLKSEPCALRDAATKEDGRDRNYVGRVEDGVRR